jgi:hypothetical protein
VSELVTSLVHKHYGKPILVIGGGPSALDDLARTNITPACVISANQHGYKQDTFKPDFTVCIDNKRGHTDERMEDFLRPFGKPIIGVCHWCDYRLADWPLSGNTGLTAIAVAVLMGGYPVIAVGMDGFRGDKYFHDKSDPPEHWSKTVFGKQAREHAAAMQGSVVMAMSGPLVDVFSPYDPLCMPVQFNPPFVTRISQLEAIQVRATREFFWFNAMVKAGTEITASKAEALWMKRQRYAEPLASAISLV